MKYIWLIEYGSAMINIIILNVYTDIDTFYF